MDADGVVPGSAGFRLLGGRYEVAEVIGRGGMGEVRAGTDRRLGRPVAIKLLRADMAHQPDVRHRFEDEARLAARLVHPHVVAVFDTGEEAGIPYLVMERLSGRTLADDLAVGPLESDAVRTLGIQILDALGAAHDAGLVHRDVKPGNVLGTTPGCWKVGDFGIAKSLEVSDHNVTVAGMIIGTPGYLAPERLAGGPATVSSDLYAAGVVLYEALSGRRLVEPGAPLAALLTATPPDVVELRTGIDRSVGRVVMRAIARDPAERFATAAEMGDALRQAGSEGADAATVAMAAAPPVTAAEPAPATRVLTQPVGPAASIVAPTLWGRVRGDSRLVMSAAIAAAVMVVVVLIIAVGSGGGHRHHTPAASTTTTPGATTPNNTPTTTPDAGASPATMPAPLDSALRDLERQVRP